MLTIKVWCLPPRSEQQYQDLFGSLVSRVTSIKPLKKAGYRDENNMLILFPPDGMRWGLGSEILIEVTGLRKEGTRPVRSELAKKLGRLLKQEFPDAQNVRCRIPKPSREDVEVCVN